VTQEVLPDDGPAEVGGTRLPPGRRLPPGPGCPAPMVWATDEPVDGAEVVFRSVRGSDERGALVPLVLHGIGGDVGERPWDNAEFDVADLSRMEQLDPAEVLADWWAMSLPDPHEDEEETAELLWPFSRTFPGLAPGEDSPLADDELREGLRALPEGRFGLIATARPADVLAVLGWQGASNYDQAPDELSVVLRSWEARFGAVLVAVGFDTLHLLVERPPRSLESAARVAAEHAAFCSDNVGQGAGSVMALAQELVKAPIWSFWWD
jgi:hypothetical protein